MDGPLPVLVVPGCFGMAKLAPGAAIPDSVLKAQIAFVARTQTELSIVAPIDMVETMGAGAGRFKLLRIDMTFGTTETGILKRLIDPLAAAGIWVLALGTHDTDYVLVRLDQFSAAVGALIAAGHAVDEG